MYMLYSLLQIFGGNMDQNTERRHYLNSPVSARFVRVRPLTWHKRIGMRAAVIGCPHRGDCGVGFFRVNSGSACGESIEEEGTGDMTLANL